MELVALLEQYKSLSTADCEGGGIEKQTFEMCLGPLGMERNLISDRIFAFFDQNQDSLIDFREFVSGLGVLCKGTLDEKIHRMLTGYRYFPFILRFIQGI